MPKVTPNTNILSGHAAGVSVDVPQTMADDWARRGLVGEKAKAPQLAAFDHAVKQKEAPDGYTWDEKARAYMPIEDYDAPGYRYNDLMHTYEKIPSFTAVAVPVTPSVPVQLLPMQPQPKK